MARDRASNISLKYDSEPASDEDDDAMERAADRFEAAFAVHTAEAHGGDAAATTGYVTHSCHSAPSA